MTKRYMIDDLQNVGKAKYWAWTKEKPMTHDEIIDLFGRYVQQEKLNLKKEDLSFKRIQDTWDCEIIEVTE